MRALLAALAVAASFGSPAFADDGGNNLHVYFECQKDEAEFEISVDREVLGTFTSHAADASPCWGQFDAFIAPGKHTLTITGTAPRKSRGSIRFQVGDGGYWVVAIPPQAKRGLVSKRILYRELTRQPNFDENARAPD